MRLVTGKDNVDTWKKNTWDTILGDTRLVISTPQVLRDALAHAYVVIGDLALLVFDEGMHLPLPFEIANH